MKLLLSTLFLFTTCISCSYAQSGATDAGAVRTLLPNGRHMGRLFLPVPPELTPEEKKIQGKITKFMMENAAWVRDSVGQSNYLDRMMEKAGVTPEEQAVYIKTGERKSTGIRITGTDSFEIVQKGNIISFHGMGRLRQLDSLRIDLSANKAVFGGQDIPFVGVTEKKEPEGPFRNVSKTYLYEYRPEPDPNGDIVHIADNLTEYMVGMGRVDDTGETLLALIALKNTDRRTVLNVTLSMLFR